MIFLVISRRWKLEAVKRVRTLSLHWSRKNREITW